MQRSAKPEILEQRVYWVPASGEALLDREDKPLRVWTVAGAWDPKKKPKLPIVLQHGRTAFLEDEIHDWKWHQGVGSFWIRYRSRLRDHSAWILCEFEPEHNHGS